MTVPNRGDNSASSHTRVGCALKCQRSPFDIPARITWLDAAYMTPMSQATAIAGVKAVERTAATLVAIDERTRIVALPN